MLAVLYPEFDEHRPSPLTPVPMALATDSWFIALMNSILVEPDLPCRAMVAQPYNVIPPASHACWWNSRRMLQ